MIFELKGVKCALVDNVFSYKGEISLFKMGEAFLVEGTTYRIGKINISPFVHKYVNVTISKVM